MKNNKLLKMIAFVMTLIICVGGASSVTFAKKAKIKTKKITITKGKSYKLPYKKGYTYKRSSKKVLKITKKGKITGRREGKCIVKVYKKGKLKRKYNVVVREIRYGTNLQDFIVERIEKIDDEYSYVYCSPKYISGVANTLDINLSRDGFDSLRIFTRNSEIERENPQVGDEVTYLWSLSLKKKVVDNCLEYSGMYLMRVIKRNS